MSYFIMEKSLEGNELLYLKNCMVLWNLSINKSADKAYLVWYLKIIDEVRGFILW